jgi:hypothetical protein
MDPLLPTIDLVIIGNNDPIIYNYYGNNEPIITVIIGTNICINDVITKVVIHSNEGYICNNANTYSNDEVLNVC